MPLEHSASPQALKRNMHTLMADIGKSPHVQSRAQAIAIGLETQRRAARGHSTGGVAGYDIGGGVDPIKAAVSGMQQQPFTAGVLPIPGIANPGAPSSAAAMATTSPSTGVQPPMSAGMMSPQAPGAQSAQSPGALPLSTNNAPNNMMPVQAMFEGGVANRDGGGGMNMTKSPNLTQPWQERQEARAMHVGPVMSNVPGRVDNHPIKVPASSYVFPAAHVSAVGQGNSLAGMNIISKMYNMGPYGTSAPKMAHGSLPRPPKPMTNFADGGVSEGGSRGEGHPQSELVPVNVSGGEVIVPPENIIQKHGSIKAGHKIMDAWVMSTRRNEIKTLHNLPPPAKK